jgi:hypothetical protein
MNQESSQMSNNAKSQKEIVNITSAVKTTKSNHIVQS